jgi:hypothetical protein
MIKPVFALVLSFAAIFGQIVPGCDGDNQVIVGYVEEKYVFSESGQFHVIVVDRTHYNVSPPFWLRVGVGDRVRYDGRTWTITRRAGEPSNLIPIQVLPSPSPTPRP